MFGKVFTTCMSLLVYVNISVAGGLNESDFNLVTVPVRQINNIEAKLDEVLQRLDKLEKKPVAQVRKPTVVVSSTKSDDDVFEEPKAKKKTPVKRSSPVRYYYAPPVYYGGGFGGFGSGGGSCGAGG